MIPKLHRFAAVHCIHQTFLWACHYSLESWTLAISSSLRGLRVESKSLIPSARLRFTFTTPLCQYFVMPYRCGGGPGQKMLRPTDLNRKYWCQWLAPQGEKCVLGRTTHFFRFHTWNSSSMHCVTVKTSTVWIWRVKLSNCLIPRCPQEKTFL